jgi:hypothetical protein
MPRGEYPGEFELVVVLALGSVHTAPKRYFRITGKA